MKYAGWTLLILHLVFIALGILSEPAERPLLFRLAVIYLVGGLLALALSWLLNRTSWRAKYSRSRRENGQPKAEKEGSVLIMVLIVTALVSGLVLQAQMSARLHHRLEETHVRTVRLRHAATDALRDALIELANDDDLQVDHLDEDWAQPRGRTDPSGIPTLVTIVDENRFFDANNLSLRENPALRPPPQIARNLLNLCGDFTPETRIQALRDWVDDDSAGMLEQAHYDEKSPAYDTPDRVMYGWNEFLLVEAWKRPLFTPRAPHEFDQVVRANLIDTTTVIPIPRKSPVPVNINTASRETLQAVVGMGNSALVAGIITRRKVAPIRNFAATGLTIDPNLIQALGPYLSLASSYFRVHATAYEESHTESVEALVLRDTRGSVEILQWIF